jgi:gluconokinase
LSWNTSALDLLRAGLESVALRLGLVYQQFGTYSNGVNQVIAGGGALRRSVVMPQILSDVLGQPISLSAIEETSSRGAALVALRSIGALPSFEDAPDLLGPTFEPSLDHHHIYQSAMDRQRRLYQAFLDSPERDPTSNSSP